MTAIGAPRSSCHAILVGGSRARSCSASQLFVRLEQQLQPRHPACSSPRLGALAPSWSSSAASLCIEERGDDVAAAAVAAAAHARQRRIALAAGPPPNAPSRAAPCAPATSRASPDGRKHRLRCRTSDGPVSESAALGAAAAHSAEERRGLRTASPRRLRGTSTRAASRADVIRSAPRRRTRCVRRGQIELGGPDVAPRRLSLRRCASSSRRRRAAVGGRRCRVDASKLRALVANVQRGPPPLTALGRPTRERRAAALDKIRGRARWRLLHPRLRSTALATPGCAASSSGHAPPAVQSSSSRGAHRAAAAATNAGRATAAAAVHLSGGRLQRVPAAPPRRGPARDARAATSGMAGIPSHHVGRVRPLCEALRMKEVTSAAEDLGLCLQALAPL